MALLKKWTLYMDYCLLLSCFYSTLSLDLLRTLFFCTTISKLPRKLSTAIKDSTSTLSAFKNNIRDFIASAEHHGIAVEALFGSSNWANDTHFYIVREIILFVLNFNVASEYKFSGIHIDIEPYQQKGFHHNENFYYTNFLKAVSVAKEMVAGASINFTIDIPYWYDEKKIQYHNKKGTIFEHLVNILKKDGRTLIVIMAYRNTAEGVNGVIEKVRDEFMYLQIHDIENVKIIIGQEFTQQNQAHITYFGKSRQYINTQLTKIEDVLSSTYPFYSGIAFHDAKQLLEDYSICIK